MKTPELGRLPLAFLPLSLVWVTACGEPVPSSAEAAPPAVAQSRDAVSAAAGGSDPLFVDAAAAAGLGFTHWNGMTGEYNYPEMMGSGVALFDYDNDGDLDVYLVQGAALGEGAPLFPPAGPLPASDRLFRNDLAAAGGALAFTDVTEECGLEARGYGMGVTAADFDNDGWIDLYVTNLGANQLLRNNGRGTDGRGTDGRVTFTDVTDASGTGDRGWGVSAAVADFDRDGWLDLYVGNYVEWSRSTEPHCNDELGIANYCGPLAFPATADRLYRNHGAAAGGRIAFDDVSARAGIRSEVGGALGVAVADFDDDGWLDLYVANDGLPNQLWINQGGLRFVNQALLAGCAVNAAGRPEASMGLSAADFDGDGDEDLFLTHLDQETNTVYVNDGRGLFEDRSVESGLGSPSWSYTGFGTAWFDYDNDGWLDLLAVNGAVRVIKTRALAGDPLPLRQANLLFHNRGGGADGRVTFEDVTARGGAALTVREVSRGAAFGDLDNDGDTDVVISNNSAAVQLLLNQVGQASHWLGLRLVTGGRDGAVRDAWGARVTVVRGDGRTLVRRVGGTASYASSSDPRLLFGLGDAVVAPRVGVRWGDGSEEEWDGLEIDRYTTLRQGTGQRPAEASR